ncbi:protein-export chaperone SecB [Candidatus Thiosymbion oneisti]|uniref:protein-export chaperone SecB n=1 Tax=Candidatus Thiosymbion oneisti TaxID=589554 RepID=UPI000A610A40|nr:protein-export chaperone SecB [Candidatus Thiosymbion oneisti]
MTENEQQNERQFVVHRIYTKDLSYEAPNAPHIFRQEWQPKLELNMNTQANKLDADTFEVILSVTATTKLADQTASIVEVHLAGLFGIQGFPDPELAHLLGAYCPNLLFPYVREVVSDLVAKGSFPQLVLQPVNFDALFAQHQQQMADQAKGNPAPTSH